MRLYSLAMNVPWGPSHNGQWAFGTSFEDALRRYNTKFPNRRSHVPNTEGYGGTYGLDEERLLKEQGEAFDYDEDELHKDYKKTK